MVKLFCNCWKLICKSSLVLGLYQSHISNTEVVVYYLRGGGPRNLVYFNWDSPVTSASVKFRGKVNNYVPLVVSQLMPSRPGFKKKKKAWGENAFKSRVAQSSTGNLGGDFASTLSLVKTRLAGRGLASFPGPCAGGGGKSSMHEPGNEARRGHSGSSYAYRPSDNDQEWRTLETKISLIAPVMIRMSFHLEGSAENCRLVDEAFFIPDFAETLLILDLWHLMSMYW